MRERHLVCVRRCVNKASPSSPPPPRPSTSHLASRHLDIDDGHTSAHHTLSLPDTSLTICLYDSGNPHNMGHDIEP